MLIYAKKKVISSISSNTNKADKQGNDDSSRSEDEAQEILMVGLVEGLVVVVAAEIVNHLMICHRHKEMIIIMLRSILIMSIVPE